MTSGSEHSALADLLARVEKAEGADRAIDRDIHFLIERPDQPQFHRDLAVRDNWRMAQFTASLDTALALVGRVLPGWDWMRGWNGRVCVFEVDGDAVFGAFAKTPALALLAALLTALIAQAAGPAIGPLDRLDEDNMSSVAKSAPTQAGRASDAEGH